VGWYRKNFSVLLDLAGNNTKTAASIASGAIRVILTFDGVYMDSTMWVNEIPLGNHPYGYTTFSYELPTSALSLEGENILAVKVDNRGSNSRWYSGSGIYRHVRLMLLNATVAIAREGVVVTTPSVSIADDARLAAEQSGVPAVTATSATIAVTLTLEATPSAPVATVTVTLASATTPKTVIATQSIQVQQLRKERRVVTLTFKQSDVDLWSPISPNLYIATATVAGQDAVKVTFGVRDFSFDVNKGFVINAASMKLKGGCVHHDNGALGSAAIDAADRRRVKVLKDNGYNAIRTSHNPVSPAFLDACDELGVIVMDEAFDCWFDGKNSADYHVYFLDWWQRDVASMVKRDINHASVLMWSIGNEIPGRDSPEGYAYAQNISDYIRKLDKGGKRAVTSAYPGVNNKADPYFAALDVAGYNYGNSLYKSDHDRVPTRIMVGTESFPAATATVWSDVEADPWVIGDFIWTAIDYIGESSIGANGHNAGGSSEDFDACGGYCTQVSERDRERQRVSARRIVIPPATECAILLPCSPEN
jgi:beta-galactosidase